MSFSIINGTNGFSDRAQRAEDNGGDTSSYIKYGIYQDSFQPGITANYNLTFLYRSNVHLSVGGYPYTHSASGTVSANTGNATTGTLNNISLLANEYFYVYHDVQTYLEGSSSSSITLPTSGTQNLTVDLNLDWLAGFGIKVYYSGDYAKYFTGYVSSYTPGTGAMSIVVDANGGTGTYSSWNLEYYPRSGSGLGPWFEIDEINLYQI